MPTQEEVVGLILARQQADAAAYARALGVPEGKAEALTTLGAVLAGMILGAAQVVGVFQDPNVSPETTSAHLG